MWKFKTMFYLQLLQYLMSKRKQDLNSACNNLKNLPFHKLKLNFRIYLLFHLHYKFPTFFLFNRRIKEHLNSDQAAGHLRVIISIKHSGLTKCGVERSTWNIELKAPIPDLNPDVIQIHSNLPLQSPFFQRHEHYRVRTQMNLGLSRFHSSVIPGPISKLK